VLERDVVDGRDDWTWSKGRRGVLNVEQIDGTAAQLCGERERDAHEGRVRQRPFHTHVRPAILESLDGRLLRHIQSVTIDLINFCESLNQISNVTLIARQPRPDRMRVNGDVKRKC
jgi:hypothetical protein